MQTPFPYVLPELERLETEVPLQGREAELQLLSVLLDTVEFNLSAGPRALTISGEMGVGKSRLLSTLCRDAQSRGFRTLETSVYEAVSTFPYFPFIETLRPVLHSASQEQLSYYVGASTTPSSSAQDSTHLENVATVGPSSLVSALAQLFPELPKLLSLPLPQEATPLSSEQQKFRLFDSIATLLERLSLEQPVLFSVDNLHWADKTSLELMMYLTVRLHKRRVALVGGTRPPRTRSEEDTDQPAASNTAAAKAISDLIRRGTLLYLSLSPLSSEAASQHLYALLPGSIPQDVEQTLLVRSEGNPFFLEELVRMLIRSHQLELRENAWQFLESDTTRLPESILLAVKERLQDLSEPCQSLLQVAALFGRTFPVEALALIFIHDEIDALLAEAERSSVIAPRPNSSVALASSRKNVANALPGLQTSARRYYIFCQGIVQEVLQGALPLQRVRLLHKKIGQALEMFYAHEAGQHAAELARHYMLGGEQEATLHWNLRAGEDAARQHASHEAIAHFQVALQLIESGQTLAVLSPYRLPTPAELAMTIGELWFKQGELGHAAAAFERVIVQSQATELPALVLARAHRQLSDLYRMQCRYEEAFAHLQAASSALDVAPEQDDEHSVTSADRSLPWLPERTVRHGGSVDSGRTRSREQIQLLQAQAMLDLLLNRAVEAESALWHSHQLACITLDRESQAFALHMIGWLRGWGKHIDEAIRLLKQAHEFYLAIGDPFRATFGDQLLGMIYLSLGEVEQAILFTQRGIERANLYGIRRVAGWLHWNQAVIALFQSRWKVCEAHLQQAQQEALDLDDRRLQAATLQVMAECHYRLGDWHSAELLFKNALQLAVNTEWYFGTMALYSHFLAVTGRRSQAHEQLEQLAELTEPQGLTSHFYIPFLVECYLHLDAPERAFTYIERLRELRGFLYYGNSVDRVLGVVAIQMGEWETAEDAFNAGLVLCRRTNNRAEEAAILHAQARAALIRGSDVDQIRILCSQARALFLDCDMQRSVAMVDELSEGVSLLKRDLIVDPSSTSDATCSALEPAMLTEHVLESSLTRRELEVLHLVAEGHTDREVAETLIISPRTVNRHLSNIFVKLDVPGRAAAVALAIRHGFV